MTRHTIASVAWVGLVSVTLVACASRQPGNGHPDLPSAGEPALRNPDEARRLTGEASAIATNNPIRAEELLRRALAADLFHGPAHNNLGVLFLKRTPPLLYEAAEQFEWARKLMPGHPDPRLNLALTLEMAGRTDEAIATYKTALEVYPGHIQSMQALARLQLWSGAPDEKTPALVREIALRGETEAWRAWARARQVSVSAGAHEASSRTAGELGPGTGR